MGYADRLPLYLKDNPVWVDLANALDTVLGNYVDIPTQKLSYIRDVNDFHPDALAAKTGVAMLDGNDYQSNGIEWNPTSTRRSLAALVGMSYAGLSNMPRDVYNVFIKHSVQFLVEQGTPSWGNYLGFTNDLVVQIQQLWAEVGPGNTYHNFLTEGDPGIGTPVWQGGMWFPTSHYDVTVYTNFNLTVNVNDFSVLLEFAAPANVVFRNISIGAVYYGLAMTASMSAAESITNTTMILPNPAWTTSSNMLTSVSALAACGSNITSLAFGGNTGSAVVSTSQLYNAGSWTSGSSLITARQNHGGTGVPTAALCAGGNTGTTPTTAVESYNGTAWTSGVAMGTARSGLALVGSNTSTLAVGGNNGTSTIATTETYNGGSWTAGGSMLSAREFLSCLGNPTNAIAIAGQDNTPSVLNTSETYNGTTWVAGPNLHNARVGSVATGSSLVVAGGPTTSSVYAGAEIYNNGVWSFYGKNMNTGRVFASGSGNNASSVVYGGTGSTGTLLGSTEVLS
jgi:hypothetical protein